MDIPKLFGHMILSQVKEQIMSKFQIGTKAGHRGQEHLFTLKSVIALYNYHKLPIIIQLYEVSKFFDAECLRDGMDALNNMGSKGKLYRLFL